MKKQNTHRYKQQREGAREEGEEGKGGQILVDRKIDRKRLWVVNTVQYTDDVSVNCILETYIILLTNVTPIILIKTL